MSLVARVWQHRRGRLGLALSGALVASALLADLVASDLPLAVRTGGQTYVFPALTRPAPLHGQTQQTLAANAEWLLPTPIPFGPNQTYANTPSDEGLAPWRPSRHHLLGTDEVGRDVFARLVHGTRVSLFVGLVAMLLCVALGLLLGTLAGWYGGWVDAAISRLTEVMLSFPTLFFFLAVLGLMRVSSLWPLVLVLGLTRWTDVSRLVRAEVLRIRGLDFVTAARALGLSNARVLWTHVVPNAMGPVLVAATFGVASAILIESALSFLGLGAPPPTSSWGELLTQAHRNLTHPGAWWLAVFPGLAIAGSVIAIHLLGEGLRAALERRA